MLGTSWCMSRSLEAWGTIVSCYRSFCSMWQCPAGAIKWLYLSPGNTKHLNEESTMMLSLLYSVAIPKGHSGQWPTTCGDDGQAFAALLSNSALEARHTWLPRLSPTSRHRFSLLNLLFCWGWALINVMVVMWTGWCCVRVFWVPGIHLCLCTEDKKI